MANKVILFGGTFDPIHVGHIQVAHSAAETIGADKIVFIPARRSPHKNILPLASGQDRGAMINLAIAGLKGFEVNECELQRPEPSYTLDTVRAFIRMNPGAEIHWLMGADAVTDLAKWYGVRELVNECTVCVMYRGGVKKPCFSGLEGVLGPSRVEKLEQNIIATPLVEISSTEIRSKLARGEDVSGLLSPAVAEYITKNGLYKPQ